MPTHYEIVYLNVTGDPKCKSASSLEVTLVQDYIVKHPSASTSPEFVDRIIIYYTPDALGNYPTAGFELTLHDLSYKMDAPAPVVTPSGAAGAGVSLSDNVPLDLRVATFTVPNDVSTSEFEFGVGVPGTKLKVRVKKQTGSFSC